MRYAGGLLLKYPISFDRYFRVPDGERFEQMRADFAALLDARRAEAEQDDGSVLPSPVPPLAPQPHAPHTAPRPPGVVVMYTHPCRTVTAAFPSNFTAGRNPPRAEWQPAPLRPKAEVDALMRDFDAFLRWIVELRASGHVALTTYRELDEQYRQPTEARLRLHDVLELARAAAVDDSAIEPRMIAGQWLSPAEQYGVVAAAVAHSAVWRGLPREVPVRRLLGPIDHEAAPLAPAAAGGSVSLQAGQRAAVEADEQCAATGAVPVRVDLQGGGAPGRVMRVLSRVLVAAAGPGRPAAIAVPTGGDEPALAQREDFQQLRFQNTWSIFPPDFRGERLLEQARWQTWSAKPA
jgi:hypothetical protein